MNIRRIIATAGVGLMATTVAVPASAAHKARIEGADRFETAVEVSMAAFTSADNAIVTTGRNFPDALAASYLSQQLDGAPILLTEPGELTQSTSDELDRLGVSTVYLLGGEAAVSAAVEAALAGSFDIVRIDGENRYETAQQIAEFDPDPDDGSDVGTLGASGRTAFIATGEKFPDALAAGPLSYAASFPIILTESGTLSDEASEALDNLDIEYAVILGGEVAISAGVQAAIEAKDITTTRLAGEDRQATAVAVADFARGPLGFTQDQAFLATGVNFPDALSAGPYGGRLEAPIVLTVNADQVGSSTLNFLDAQSGRINTLLTLGGQVAITTATEDAAAAAIE